MPQWKPDSIQLADITGVGRLTGDGLEVNPGGRTKGSLNDLSVLEHEL
jgi:hypothetical protein